MEDTKNELGYIRNMLKLLDTHDLVAIVGDSYNIFHFCELVGSIKDEVIAKTQNGKFLVIRPDSGDPIIVLSKMLLILEKLYGAPKNTKGYKVLNNVRVIWGDGINIQSLEAILNHMVDYLGYSADNFAFGMGGALLGAPQRDDLQFAMKASSVMLVGGIQRDVFKDPITDSGKTSKKGRVTLWESGGEYKSGVDRPQGWTNKGFEWSDAMQTYFENGYVLFKQTFDQVRANSNL